LATQKINGGALRTEPVPLRPKTKGLIMSATNALTKSVHQTATPKLRTSTILGSSRREEALILFPRVHVRQTPLHSIPPFSLSVVWHYLGFGFWDFLPANFRSEMLPKNLKHFRLKLKSLALYQALTKNLTQKAEMPEMLKWYFEPWPFESFLWSLDIYRSPPP
jgi:hypothetical protein